MLVGKMLVLSFTVPGPDQRFSREFGSEVHLDLVSQGVRIPCTNTSLHFAACRCVQLFRGVFGPQWGAASHLSCAVWSFDHLEIAIHGAVMQKTQS